MGDDAARARDSRRERTQHIRDRFVAAASVHPADDNGFVDRTPTTARLRRRLAITPFSATPRARAFAMLLAFRVFNAFALKTFYAPDEYWQSLEVAHRLVFGFGYLTWEWREGIRTYAHPLLFAAGYKLLQICRLDETELLIYVPMLTQAAVAAVGDWHVYMLAFTLFRSRRIAKFALVLQLTSWWNWFCSTRTLVNSAEACLTAVALARWPWNTSITERGDGLDNALDLSVTKFRYALGWAAATCIMRPTNAMIWVYLGSGLILRNPSRRVTVMISTVLIMCLAVIAMLVMDRVLYGRWIFTPLNFVSFNVTYGLSAFYGTTTWHWYISQGLPLMGFFAVPLFAVGALRDARVRSLAWLLAWVIFCYSLLGHKEFRFLYPAMPVVMAGAGVGMQRVEKLKGRKTRLLTLAALGILAAANFLLAFYATRVHQRGVLDVMHYLRRETRRSTAATPVRSVGFLMPCHSTPFYSHVHKDIPMWFLTCEPPLRTDDEDEADVFYQDPLQFIRDRFEPLPSNGANEFSGAETPADARPRARFKWPSHLVLFDALNTQTPGLLANSTYRECARFFNSHFHHDWRRKGDVVVYCLGPGQP